MTDKTAVQQFTGIKAVAFDLDGTLTDSIQGLAEATDRALEALGYRKAGREMASVWVGNGVDMLLERALTHATGENLMLHCTRNAVSCLMILCRDG